MPSLMTPLSISTLDQWLDAFLTPSIDAFVSSTLFSADAVPPVTDGQTIFYFAAIFMSYFFTAP